MMRFINVVNNIEISGMTIYDYDNDFDFDDDSDNNDDDDDSDDRRSWP